MFSSINVPETGEAIITLSLESTGQSKPCWGSESLRMYSGSTFKITVGEGYILKSIVFTTTGDKYNNLTSSTVSEGSITGANLVNTWTPSENKTDVRSFTIKTSGQSRVSHMKVTYTEAVEKPEAVTKFQKIEQIYDPEKPSIILENYEPADLLEGATVIYSGATEYIDANGTIVASNEDAVEEMKVTVSWTNSKYKDDSAEVPFLILKADPVFKYETEDYTAKLGDNFPTPKLTNPLGLNVRYEVEPEGASNAVSVNPTTGEVTLLKEGTDIINALTDGNKLYGTAKASYMITVKPEGKPAVPEFNFEGDMVDGKYTVGTKLSIETATTGAQIWYSLDGAADKEYTAAIELNEAKEYKVKAYAKKGENQSDVAEKSFTIVKKVHDYVFGTIAEQMVGRDRYFTMPALVGAEGVEVKYEATGDGVVVKNPGSIKGIEDAYFIIGDGTAVVKATIAGDNTYDEFTKTLDVTIVPEETKTETKKNVEFDFSKLDELGLNNFSASEKNEQYIQLAERTLEKSGVKISFAANNGTLGPRIAVANNYMAIYKPKSGDGGAFTITATQISKVEITIGKNDAGTYAYTEGVLSNLVSKVRTWTPKDGKPVDCFTLTNKGSDNPQITKIKVYYTEVTEGGEPAQPFNMAFSAEEYELEEGDMMPNVVLPDDFTGEVKYLVNGEPKNVGYRFPASEEAYEIIAYTEGDAKRLPAVDKTIVYAYGYELADVLAIHYSTENTPVHYSTVAYSAPKTIDGDVHRYEFTDIDVKGYDGVDGKTYGHVFFSFTPAPGEATALAPRREAAEGDWASFNANTDIYSAATHLTEAGENTPLVRHRAGTLGDAMPAVFRVQSSAETGQMYNFTVNLDKNGTSSVTAVQSQTQTGVESVGVDADGEAEYYTLQGVRVAKPAAGIYLRRQGGTVSKVLVK